MSKEDIKLGKRWVLEVAGELEASNFGILCVTSENIRSPWLLFEAGALSKSIANGTVVPFLLDIDWVQLVESPLSAFQGAEAGEAAALKIAQRINELITPPEEAGRIVDLAAWAWPDLHTKLEKIRATGSPAEIPPSPKQQHDTVKALASAVGDLDRRFEAVSRMLNSMHKTLEAIATKSRTARKPKRGDVYRAAPPPERDPGEDYDPDIAYERERERQWDNQEPIPPSNRDVDPDDIPDL
jgi:hypothetical protein